MWPLGGKRMTIGWEGRRVWCGKQAPLRLWPPSVSVKNWWVGPREQVLNVPIACQRYGLSKPSSQLSIEAWLFPMISLAIVEEKLGTDPWIGQPSCCGLGREPFFSWTVDLFKSVSDYVKGCYVLTAWDTYAQGPYTDQVFDACGMLVGFPL
jgi:hypothetical protein